MAKGRKKKEEPVKILTEPEKVDDEVTIVEPETPQNEEKTPKRQNNDVNILTLGELYRNIIHDKQTSHTTKMLNVQKFVDLHEGFSFPPNTPDVYKIIYIESVAHFKLYEESL